MNLTLFQRLNDLICLQKTGPVDSLAVKLGISSRQVKYIIKKMRQDCAAPIWFNHSKQSYVYTQEGTCDFKFQLNKKTMVSLAIKDALNKCFALLLLGYWFLPDFVAQVNNLSAAGG